MKAPIRALAPLVLAVPLLLLPFGCDSRAAAPRTERLPEGHPTMRELRLGGRTVCLLERDGVRYAVPGSCSSAPPLEESSPGGEGNLPPGHPPVGPGTFDPSGRSVEI
jgi:hypothetical protein